MFLRCDTLAVSPLAACLIIPAQLRANYVLVYSCGDSLRTSIEVVIPAQWNAIDSPKWSSRASMPSSYAAVSDPCIGIVAGHACTARNSAETVKLLGNQTKLISEISHRER